MVFDLKLQSNHKEIYVVYTHSNTRFVQNLWLELHSHLYKIHLPNKNSYRNFWHMNAGATWRQYTHLIQLVQNSTISFSKISSISRNFTKNQNKAKINSQNAFLFILVLIRSNFSYLFSNFLVTFLYKLILYAVLYSYVPIFSQIRPQKIFSCINMYYIM